MDMAVSSFVFENVAGPETIDSYQLARSLSSQIINIYIF